MGVNATWDLIDELTPAIPFLKRVVDHVEKSFDLEHSTRHTIPNPELGISGILRSLADAHVFDYRSKRADPAEDSPAKDFVSLGETQLQDTKYLEEIFNDRWSYIAFQSTLEDYSHIPPDESDPNRSLHSEEANRLDVDQEDQMFTDPSGAEVQARVMLGEKEPDHDDQDEATPDVEFPSLRLFAEPVVSEEESFM
jgi:hypothetical protein